MKIFFNKPRFSYGILWILLIVSITGVYLSMHNHLAELQVKAPVYAISFAIFAIAISLFLYQQFYTTVSKLDKSNSQLDQLKKSIQESKKKDETIEIVNEEEQKEENIEEEAQSYFVDLNHEKEETFMEKLLSNVSNKNEIVQSLAFKKDKETQIFSILASYAYFSENAPPTFTIGETLPGQVAKNKIALNLKEIPEDYINVVSGLGQGTPKNLLLVPMISNDNECIGVLEFASFKEFSESKIKLFESISRLAVESLNNIGNSSKD